MAEQVDEIYVGRDFGRHDIVIDAAEVAKYAGALDDHNPIYTGASPFGGPVAPALVRHSEVYEYRDAEHPAAPSWYLPTLYGNLHARQEFEMFAPVMVGDVIYARSVIADRYVKRGRDYVVPEDLFQLAEDVVLHRIRLSYEALAEGQKPAKVLEEILKKLG